MQAINNAKLQILVLEKRLITVAGHVDNAFKYSMVEHKVAKPASLSDWKVEEHIMYFNEFGRLDKVDFNKYASDMICAKVDNSTKIETKLIQVLTSLKNYGRMKNRPPELSRSL